MGPAAFNATTNIKVNENKKITNMKNKILQLER